MTEQRVAVVTGASRGVGKGIAVALGAAGYTVYVTGRSTGDQVTFPTVGGTIEQTAEAVTAAGGTGIPVVCDHTDDDRTAALFERVRAEHQGLDLLVNNVWGGYAAYHENRYQDMSGPFWEQPLRVWDDMFTSGVRAHYAATVLAVPVLRPGALVVTISFFPGSYLNGEDQVAYSVAKAADDRMMAVTAAQLAERDVTAVALYPGLVRTEGVLRAGDFFDLSNSESPEFVGRAVAALAADPEVRRHTGRCLVAAELAEQYGFTDVDGARPSSVRAHFAGRATVDPRLRGAVDASVGWYEDLCTLHGVDTTLADGLWSAVDAPPPLHSDAVAVEPEVTADQVLSRLAGRQHCGVKDSFATMDLTPHGMRLLFSATWIHRAPTHDRRQTTPTGWTTVTDEDELARWTAQHDTQDVLLPPLLRRAHFRILARYVDDRIVAGAVARLGSGAVDVSNVYAIPGHHVDWAELAEAIETHFPGRPLVGYERGEALAAAQRGGFSPVGDLRVWVR